LNKSAV